MSSPAPFSIRAAELRDVAPNVQLLRELRPPGAEFFLEHEGHSLRFRLHRGRLKQGSPNCYDVQDLRPTLNGVTAGSRGTRPEALFLWLAERDRLVDVWAVTPLKRLEAQEGTQLASFGTRGSKCWGMTYRLPRVEVDLRALEALAPPPVHRDVETSRGGV